MDFHGLPNLSEEGLPKSPRNLKLEGSPVPLPVSSSVDRQTDWFVSAMLVSTVVSRSDRASLGDSVDPTTGRGVAPGAPHLLALPYGPLGGHRGAGLGNLLSSEHF